ncbi:MAG: hypothetical protein V2A34_13685 [Lentisphaerota bacterium]
MKRIMLVVFIVMLAGGTGWSEMTSTVPISVAILPGGESSFRIAPGTLSVNGYVHPDSYFRFNSGIFTCEFFAAYEPWAIRTYHTNGVGSAKGPLKREDGNSYLGMRMWQPNYGVRTNFDYYGKPTNFYDLGCLPDPMMVWTSGVSRLVQNITVATNLASSAEGDASPVRFNFVITETNRTAGVYSGDIFFEFYSP